MGEALVDWLMENIMPWIIAVMFILFALFLFVGLPMFIYQEATAETFSLKKADWVCVASHKETSTTYIKSGDVMIPMTSTHDVCDTWSRKD